MKVEGIAGLSPQEVMFEVQRGGKFVLYYYCISLLVVTLRRPSPVYLVRAGENAAAKGLRWTLLSLVMGWWGIPWGPIYTVQSLIVNLRGGKDLTADIIKSLQAAPIAKAATATSHP